jgi:GT2 family glycosyltransferase
MENPAAPDGAKRRLTMTAAAGPRFSIVIPTCNRPDALARVLERLAPARQGLSGREYEVVVADDSAADDTRRMLSRAFPWVTCLAGPRRGPAANRNAGARRATGDWLVFTDDDCQPCDGWIRAIASAIEHQALDVVEGKIVAPDRRESLFRRDVENLHGDCYWSANLAVRRDYFERLGGFDEDFGEAGGEDMEFAHRLRRLGARSAFCEAALIVHPSHIMTLKDVLEFTFRIRWHLLYLLKTRQTLPADAPLWKVVPHDVFVESAVLLRTSWRTARSLARAGQGAAITRMILNWTLFPILLPYKIYWDIRFRRMLTSQPCVNRS